MAGCRTTGRRVDPDALGPGHREAHIRCARERPCERMVMLHPSRVPVVRGEGAQWPGGGHGCGWAAPRAGGSNNSRRATTPWPASAHPIRDASSNRGFSMGRPLEPPAAGVPEGAAWRSDVKLSRGGSGCGWWGGAAVVRAEARSGGSRSLSSRQSCGISWRVLSWTDSAEDRPACGGRSYQAAPLEPGAGLVNP